MILNPVATAVHVAQHGASAAKQTTGLMSVQVTGPAHARPA
jgi:hypothetical protein